MRQKSAGRNVTQSPVRKKLKLLVCPQLPDVGGWPLSRCPKNHTEGAPGPSPLGTGETPDLNWWEEPHGLAGSVPANADSPPTPPQKLPTALLHIISPSRRTLFP